MSDSRQAGLRLQIVLALAGLMLLAFVPLFFAVASLARASVASERERSVRELGRAVAIHVGDVRSNGTGSLERALTQQCEARDVIAVCAFALDGERLGCGGSTEDIAQMRTPKRGDVDTVSEAESSRGRSLQVVVARGETAVVTRVSARSSGTEGAALVRLVALYMVIFALALVVFAYFSLTRLIVRPVEQLVDAADRIASGARTLRMPRAGARELMDLGTSVQSMTSKLLSEEAKLLLKIEELTETTTRLTHTQAQLVRSERMASVGRLAAGVAHEIGNPIAAIMGMLDLLHAGDLPQEEQIDFVRRMRKETDRIHTVLRDMLDFARPEEMPASANAIPIPGDVRSVVADVTSLVKTQKSFRDAHVDVDIQGEPTVALPGPRLTQVILNLVLNAGAAVAATGIADGRVTIRARCEAALVRIVVEDNGPGVDLEVRGRLFEPFVTTKAVGEGTGLGLAVCRGLVESAGGEITLESEFKGGARFVVTLPSGGSEIP